MRLQRRCSDPDVTADVLQDTFVAVWHAAAGYRGEGDVGAWVWGIAVRRLVSRLRVRQQPRPVGEEVLAAASPAVRSAEDELLVAAEYGDVGMALRAISPELRAVVQATVLDGLTTKEAGLQDIAVGLVAGTAAWCFDEPAAAVVDTLPRSHPRGDGVVDLAETPGSRDAGSFHLDGRRGSRRLRDPVTSSRQRATAVPLRRRRRSLAAERLVLGGAGGRLGGRAGRGPGVRRDHQSYGGY